MILVHQKIPLFTQKSEFVWWGGEGAIQNILRWPYQGQGH